MRLFALRGANSAELDEPQAILDATTELMREIARRNGLEPAETVSCIFTATADLSSEFPAVAARAIGFDRVPLLCAQEIPVPGSMPRVIRVLITTTPRMTMSPITSTSVRPRPCGPTSTRHNRPVSIEFSERIRRIPVLSRGGGYGEHEKFALLASNESPFEPLRPSVRRSSRRLRP